VKDVTKKKNEPKFVGEPVGGKPFEPEEPLDWPKPKFSPPEKFYPKPPQLRRPPNLPEKHYQTPNYPLGQLQTLFKGIETDPDTHLLRIGYGHVGGYPVRKDRWNQEGVKGQSVIFRSEDVSHLSDSELENLVRDELQITGQITLGRTKRFTFVNHSFQI
jgi:hypothetical protein